MFTHLCTLSSKICGKYKLRKDKLFCLSRMLYRNLGEISHLTIIYYSSNQSHHCESAMQKLLFPSAEFGIKAEWVFKLIHCPTLSRLSFNTRHTQIQILAFIIIGKIILKLSKAYFPHQKLYNSIYYVMQLWILNKVCKVLQCLKQCKQQVVAIVLIIPISSKIALVLRCLII
jgi:hypothetical protein